MLFSFIAALMLSAAVQEPTADRSRAEELARTGHSAEARELFAHITELNPGDVEARLWMARMDLRLGNTAAAESGFRAVLQDHPADVDARIGLGMVLTRNGSWQEALQILTEAERDSGQNADLFGALARAYRRGGDDGRALEYFRRAKALSPDDPDLQLGFESVARTFGHWIAFDGFGQWGAPGAEVESGSLTASFRVTPRLHLEASARKQQGEGYSDGLAGGGLFWRAPRSTTVEVGVVGGPSNTALPGLHLSSDVVHYTGAFEAGVGVRRLSFAGSNLLAFSPTFAWDREPWRFDARYTYSRSSFDETGQSTGDHSIMFRGTWQGWRRVALLGTYARGIESFEDLTADRLGALDTKTVAGGLRIDLRSLTRITTTWEHQWRSNNTTVDRFYVSVVQSIP